MTKIILTVDDSRTMRDMLMLALSNAGYHVVQAEDGMHGLESSPRRTARCHYYGYQHAANGRFRLHRRRAGRRPHRAVPILVLTTESDASKKDRARRAGATGWIVKPFDPVKLVEAIRRVAA